MRIRAFCHGILFCMLIGTGAWASSSTQSIASINIHMVDNVVGKTTVSQIRNILPIREGDPFEPQKLDESLDFLRKWGIFETINAETLPGKEGIEIDLYLKEAILIGEIDITGNYPFIEQKVRKYLTIKPGDMYTRERAEEQIKRITDLYEREGFFNTSVSLQETWNEYSLDLTISYKISRGTLVRYRNINITGMKAYPEGRLVSAINPLRRYKPRSLNDAIRETEEFYHKHGYPRAQIEIEKKDIDLDTGRIDLDIDVSEGPKVDVIFKGNDKIGSGQLKKVVTIFEEGSFDDYEIDASKEAILAYYLSNGFEQASVDAKRKISKENKVEITFNIKEGPKKKIANIEFEGNDSISSGKLRKKMRTKEISLTHKGVYDEEVLNKDVTNLKKYYESEGYLNADIGRPEVVEQNDGLDIKIPISEDGQTKVKGIVFAGNDFARPRRLLKHLKNKIDKPFNPAMLEIDRQALLEFYADHGHPYAEVEQSVELADKGAIIRYDINEGTPVKIGEIIVIGNTLTATRSIKGSIPIREGDPYSYQKIVDGQLGLRRMGAFNSVTIEPIGLAEHEKIVHLRIAVEEQKPFVMELEASYSTDQLFTGTLNFTNLNTFGMAKRSNLALTGGQRLSKAEINWIDPRFMGSDFEMSTSTWLQYQNNLVYTYVQGGGGFGFFRRYHRTGVMAKYQLTRNYFVKGDSTEADADSLRNNTISKVALSVSFDTRNNFSDPTNGVFTMANADFYNEIKGKEANFTKLRWGGTYFLGFLKFFVLSNSFRFGDIETFGHNVSVPSNELFLMGGDDTLRGFSENSLGPVDSKGKATGGRQRLIYNGELNMKLFGNLKLAGFCDVGTLVNDFDQIGWYSTVRKSAGFGLRYITPVGPMRFDYGIKLDRKSGESFGRFHFAFGFLF